MFENKHVSKIRLIPGEFKAPDIFNPQSILDILKNRRWWVTDAQTLTFTTCPCRRFKLVTISYRPISIWHLVWIWYTDRTQFYFTERELLFVYHASTREIFSDKNPGDGYHEISEHQLK